MPRTRTSGQGRPKGLPNKINRDLKEMILGALDDKGGREYLARQADENPTAFMALVGKVLPSTMNANVSGGIMINWSLPKIPLDD